MYIQCLLWQGEHYGCLSSLTCSSTPYRKCFHVQGPLSSLDTFFLALYFGPVIFQDTTKRPMFDQEHCSPLFGDTCLEMGIVTNTPQKLELELTSNCEKAESFLQRAFQRQEVRTVPVAKRNEDLVFVWVFNKSPILYSLETRAGHLPTALRQVSS